MERFGGTLKKNFLYSQQFLPVVVSVFFGIITTIALYKGYGVGGQVEQLPLILRSMDESFLINDFFINMGESSIARRYSANFIAFLAGSESNLPSISLLLTFLANISISLLSFFLARLLSNKSDQANLFASALTMSVAIFALGSFDKIYRTELVPVSLAFPLVFAAILFLCKKKFVVSMLLCGAASFFHPLLGLEMGGLILVTFILAVLIEDHKITKDKLPAIIFGMFFYLLLCLINLVPQFSQECIDTDQFIYILAHFRAPHHYIPSSFLTSDYIEAFAFFIAVTILYFDGKNEREKSVNIMIALLGIAIVALCIGGYVFVELIPMRIWVIAQPFRLLNVLKWIGIVLISGKISDTRLDLSTRTIYVVSVLNPIIFGFTTILFSIRKWLEGKESWLFNVLSHPLILLVIVPLLRIVSISQMELILLIFYISVILILNSLPQQFSKYTGLIGLGMVMVLFSGALIMQHPYKSHFDTVNRIQNSLRKEISSELGAKGEEVVEFVRQNTDEDSIFLTPPTWGQFRLSAHRAIVVDFKAFPFNDIGIQGWYERLTDCYGVSARSGFDITDDLKENYKKINDQIIESLHKKYEFSYAILYSSTPTRYKVLFSNDRYKLIFVGNN